MYRRKEGVCEISFCEIKSKILERKERKNHGGERKKKTKRGKTMEKKGRKKQRRKEKEMEKKVRC